MNKFICVEITTVDATFPGRIELDGGKVNIVPDGRYAISPKSRAWMNAAERIMGARVNDARQTGTTLVGLMFWANMTLEAFGRDDTGFTPR